MKVLNLYAGIGGNRKLWTDVEVTAVEYDPSVAQVYKDYFPNDKVIVDDAHQYLLDHFQEFDFIWSSPPCPTHSKLNTFAVSNGVRKLEFPDMRLYQEILLMQNWAKKQKWVIENVIPYYQPLIQAEKIDRHLFWANFKIGSFEPENGKLPHKESELRYLEDFFGYKLKGYKITNKRQVLRNCVHPETGKHILDRVKEINSKKTKQVGLFAQNQ